MYSIPPVSLKPIGIDAIPSTAAIRPRSMNRRNAVHRTHADQLFTLPAHSHSCPDVPCMPGVDFHRLLARPPRLSLVRPLLGHLSTNRLQTARFEHAACMTSPVYGSDHQWRRSSTCLGESGSRHSYGSSQQLRRRHRRQHGRMYAGNTYRRRAACTVVEYIRLCYSGGRSYMYGTTRCCNDARRGHSSTSLDGVPPPSERPRGAPSGTLSAVSNEAALPPSESRLACGCRAEPPEANLNASTMTGPLRHRLNSQPPTIFDPLDLHQ